MGLREVIHESDMGLAIIGINTGPERDQSGTAFFSNRRLNFETGNVRSLPDDGHSPAAHECGSHGIVRLRGAAPVEDRLGACSHLAEIAAQMDRPQTVRALHPCVWVRSGLSLSTRSPWRSTHQGASLAVKMLRRSASAESRTIIYP